MLKYLALGDSYTIGELVNMEENFPNQLVQILKNDYQLKVELPQIIAVTGWTTDELMKGIVEQQPNPDFDFVTLLIGVNNQYRNRTLENYAVEFEKLLELAIEFAKDKANRVFVLSIPDWGFTPFAADRNSEEIAKEIDNFNACNHQIALKHACHYLDITAVSRATGADFEFLASDHLHYAAKEYEVWATMLAEKVAAEFSDKKQ